MGGSSGSNDVINQIAMQIAQQQIDNFINSGGAEAALTDLVESGKLEEMVSSMAEKAMENVDPEEILANMESNFEESLAGANGGLEEVMGGADFEELLGGVKLEELMGGMNMTEMMNGMDLNSMEMEIQCSCVPAADIIIG